MEYFIIDNNGQQAGPFSPDQLVQKAITPETLVWAQGMADWTPAWKIAELKNILEAVEANHTNTTSQEQPNIQKAAPNFQQAQDFQQAQQEAYQQGFQHGAAMHQQNQQPKKKSNKMLWKIILGCIAFILLLFAITNPSEEDHKKTVRTAVTQAIDKATESGDDGFFTQAIRSVAKMAASTMMDEAMNQLFEYHNYILFSKGTIELEGKSHTLSYGILGKVITMNADDMIKGLESTDNLKIEESESSSTDQEPSDDNNDNTTDTQGGLQQKLEDKANQAVDHVADKVSKKVEEKINQKLDEVTDSSTVEKLIDKIFSLF